MADNIKFAQIQAATLAGAGVVLGDTEVILSSFNSIDGVPLTMADFGTKGFATLEPNSGTQEEQVSFTGITQNANGTATLTGISNVLFLSPYTETSGFAKSHAGGAKFVISNTSGFYNTFTDKNDDETITGTWTFTLPNYPRMDSIAIFPTDPEQLVPKAYADSLTFNGAPNASPSVQGLVQEATTAQVNAGTNTGSTGAVLFASPADLAASIYGLQLPTSGQKAALASTTTPSGSNLYVSQTDFQKGVPIYGADSVGTDAYAITPTPAISAYSAGMVFRFKAGTANTGAATLQVGSGAAKAIVKLYNTALATGDILQNQVVEVAYNSTNDNWQMLSPSGVAPLTTTGAYANGTTTKDVSDSSGTQTIAHGLGVTPKYVRLTFWKSQGATASAVTFQTLAVYNGTTQTAMYTSIGSGSNLGTLGTGLIITGTADNVYQTGTISVNATNISIAWVKTGSPTGAYQIIWEAFGPTT